MNALTGVLAVLIIANHYNIYKPRKCGDKGKLIPIHFLSINTHIKTKFDLITIYLIIIMGFISFDLCQFFFKYGEYFISLFILSKYL